MAWAEVLDIDGHGRDPDELPIERDRMGDQQPIPDQALAGTVGQMVGFFANRPAGRMKPRFLVERVGFEPTSRHNREPDFESGAFDHSATSPSVTQASAGRCRTRDSSAAPAAV